MSCSAVIGIAMTIHVGFGHNNFNDLHPFVNCQTKDNTYVSLTINSHWDPVVSVGQKVYDNKNHMIDYGLVFGYHTSPVLPYAKLGTNTVWIMPTPDGVVAGTEISIDMKGTE